MFVVIRLLVLVLATTCVASNCHDDTLKQTQDYAQNVHHVFNRVQTIAQENGFTSQHSFIRSSNSDVTFHLTFNHSHVHAIRAPWAHVVTQLGALWTSLDMHAWEALSVRYQFNEFDLHRVWSLRSIDHRHLGLRHHLVISATLPKRTDVLLASADMHYVSMPFSRNLLIKLSPNTSQQMRDNWVHQIPICGGRFVTVSMIQCHESGAATLITAAVLAGMVAGLILPNP